MNLKYDFHIHTALSACADNEMTPQNIVSLAKLLELDAIAVTDHNSAGNCRAVIEAGARAGISVIPGMELCTAEEVHIVCLFGDIDEAERFGRMVRTTLPPIKNKPEIYGEQLLFDADDNPIGQEDALLSGASSISIDDVVELCLQYGGCAYPAHIDRPAYSVLSSMGIFMMEWGFACAEITPNADIEVLRRENPLLNGMELMHSSDSHWLEAMAEHEPYTVSPAGSSACEIVSWLRGK